MKYEESLVKRDHYFQYDSLWFRIYKLIAKDYPILEAVSNRLVAKKAKKILNDAKRYN